jgi:hypothetical protein
VTIQRVSVWSTVLFTVTSVGAAVWTGLSPVAVAVDLVLFLAGCVVFAWALIRAAGRSRDELVSLGGLFFLAEGAAPRPVAVGLWAPVAVQTVVAVTTAAARPFSELAFGVLVPLFGMALLALWSARHGHFPPREPAAASQRPRSQR